MKNIGIFGIGAIGSIVLKYLKKESGNTFYYFNRTEKDYVKIKFKEEVDIFSFKLSNKLDIELDWLIVCLKL